jgi:hypothetical protein
MGNIVPMTDFVALSKNYLTLKRNSIFLCGKNDARFADMVWL